jgi:predicted nucleic acid-binding protein
VALILDTSAVIGWVELKDAAVIKALRDYSGDASPRVHAATIGELERGVAQAADEATRARRRATLRFAREQLAPLPLDLDGDQPEAFGQIAAALSRKISHNDTWIAAAAITERRHLLTQDGELAEKASRAATAAGPLATWLGIHHYSLDVVHVPRPSA